MTAMGLVGLDTSHAEAFADVLSGRDDASVRGVWDGGAVRDSDYVQSFCDEYGARRFDEPAAMAEAVDAAMVLTVDWKTHAALAEPFLEAGVPTLVDKPLAGSFEDIATLEAAAGDTPLFGCSAVPFHEGFTALPRGGSERTLFAAGYNDYFYYRTHLADTVRFLADDDWTEVVPGSEPGTTADVHFTNDVHATLRFDGSPEDATFSVLDIGETTRTVEMESSSDVLSRTYDRFLDAFLDVTSGNRDDTGRILDSGRLALAIEAALAEGHSVTPDSPVLDMFEVTGESFLADYDPYY